MARITKLIQLNCHYQALQVCQCPLHNVSKGLHLTQCTRNKFNKCGENYDVAILSRANFILVLRTQGLEDFVGFKPHNLKWPKVIVNGVLIHNTFAGMERDLKGARSKIFGHTRKPNLFIKP